MFYMLLVLLSIILYVEDWLVTQSFKIGYIPRCFVPLLDFFLYFLSFQIFMCLGLIIFSPECHMCWTRSTNACFMNDSNSSNVSDVTCWIEKKNHVPFILCCQTVTRLGGRAVLGNHEASTSHEKPCRASPSLGILPLAPKGGLIVLAI
jgi:hypothetical protein